MPLNIQDKKKETMNHNPILLFKQRIESTGLVNYVNEPSIPQMSQSNYNARSATLPLFQTMITKTREAADASEHSYSD